MLSARQDRARFLFPMGRFTLCEIDIETVAPAHIYFLRFRQKVVNCSDRYKARLLKKLQCFCQADGQGPKQGYVCFSSKQKDSLLRSEDSQ